MAERDRQKYSHSGAKAGSRCGAICSLANEYTTNSANTCFNLRIFTFPNFFLFSLVFIGIVGIMLYSAGSSSASSSGPLWYDGWASYSQITLPRPTADSVRVSEQMILVRDSSENISLFNSSDFSLKQLGQSPLKNVSAMSAVFISSNSTICIFLGNSTSSTLLSSAYPYLSWNTAWQDNLSALKCVCGFANGSFLLGFSNSTLGLLAFETAYSMSFIAVPNNVSSLVSLQSGEVIIGFEDGTVKGPIHLGGLTPENLSLRIPVFNTPISRIASDAEGRYCIFSSGPYYTFFNLSNGTILRSGRVEDSPEEMAFNNTITSVLVWTERKAVQQGDMNITFGAVTSSGSWAYWQNAPSSGRVEPELIIYNFTSGGFEEVENQAAYETTIQALESYSAVGIAFSSHNAIFNNTIIVFEKKNTTGGNGSIRLYGQTYRLDANITIPTVITAEIPFNLKINISAPARDSIGSGGALQYTNISGAYCRLEFYKENSSTQLFPTIVPEPPGSASDSGGLLSFTVNFTSIASSANITVYFSVRAEGYLHSFTRNITVKLIPLGAYNLELILPPEIIAGENVVLRFHGIKGGQPVVNETLYLRANPSYECMIEPYRAQTDAEGNVSFNFTPVKFTPKQALVRNITLIATLKNADGFDLLEQEFRLQVKAATAIIITGVVMEQGGSPLENVTVEIPELNISVKTNSSRAANYRIVLYNESSITVWYHKEGYEDHYIRNLKVEYGKTYEQNVHMGVVGKTTNVPVIVIAVILIAAAVATVLIILKVPRKKKKPIVEDEKKEEKNKEEVTGEKERKALEGEGDSDKKDEGKTGGDKEQ